MAVQQSNPFADKDPRVIALKPSVAPAAAPAKPAAPTPPLLEVEGLNTWFPIKKGIFARTAGYVKAVNGVSFSMQAGETLGVVGESGCGKSTLSRTILRLEKPHSGAIRFLGQDVLALRGAALQQYRRDMQVVFQDPHATLNPRHSILDILTEAMLVHGLIKPKQAQDVAAELLRDVGMQPDAMHRYPHAFSGGQRQRICIARALALRPKMIISWSSRTNTTSPTSSSPTTSASSSTSPTTSSSCSKGRSSSAAPRRKSSSTPRTPTPSASSPPSPA